VEVADWKSAIQSRDRGRILRYDVSNRLMRVATEVLPDQHSR